MTESLPGVKEIAVKKQVVQIRDEEGEQVDTLVQGGKNSAPKPMKIRIRQKVDAPGRSPASTTRRISRG